MKTYLEILVNSEGSPPSKIKEQLHNLGFKATKGNYDFAYEWNKESTDVDVKIVQLEPGEDYVDLEVLSKPFYIRENEIQTINSGAFIQLYFAKGFFSSSVPICFGICEDWIIIG